MTTSDDRLEYLYRQYTDKTCTAQELDEFFSYVRDPAYKDVLEALADAHIGSAEIAVDMPKVDWEHLYARVVPVSGRHGVPGRRRRVVTMARLAAAACVILVCAGAYLLFIKRAPVESVPEAAAIAIPPGYNKAVLTLGDGATIALDSARVGELARQGDVAVVNSGAGSLVYNGATGGHAKVLYNTLTTPRGGQYQLVLPDGTKVWLNAASSITYPTVFTGSERMITMTGEAYFEVVHDGRRPFRVKAGSQLIEDIGTHFNVNAYGDEPAMVATLLEGAVKVGGRLLRPGEQASAAAGGGVVVSKGDPVQAVAWKNGFFDFTDASLQMVMRQLGRWYNVEVAYEGVIRERQFNGMIGRKLSLGQVLSGLSREGVKYKMDGNKLIIKQ